MVVTPDALQISWPTIAGKQYTLQFSTDLTLGGWSDVESPVLGNGGTLTYTFVQQSSVLFWRVIVADHDSDGDGFNDWEENQKGTDPLVADRDDDGLPDLWEIDHGLDPNDNGSSNAANGSTGDLDGDGVSNSNELAGNTNPNNAADFPVQVIQIAKGASGGSNYTAYEPPSSYVYLGHREWGPWWVVGARQEASVTDQAVTPTYLSPFLDGIPFPETPPTPPQDQPWMVPQTNLALANIYCRSRVNRPPTGNGIESGLTSSRVWIKAPAAPVARKFTFVKSRDYSTHVHVTETNPTNINTDTFVSAQVVTVEIPANETISNPIDLKYIPPITDGCDVTAYERLRPVDLDIEYLSQEGIKELEESKEDAGDGGYISLKSQTHQGEDITPTTYLVIRPITGLSEDRKVRLKFNAGGRYVVARDRLGNDPVISEGTEFPAGQETRLYLVGEAKSQTRGGEQITVQIENEGSWLDGDSLKATVVQTQFQIDLRIFIPYNWVNIPHPAHISQVAKGDNRSFDSQLNGTYRIAQWAILNLYREWVPEVENRMLDHGKSAGTSEHYSDGDVFNWDDAAKHSGDTAVKPSYINDGAPVMDSGTADLSNVDSDIVISSSDDAKCFIKFSGAASEPIITGAATIDWRINVGISKNNPLEPQFVMQGIHDGFPAYEIYINSRHSIFQSTNVLQWLPGLKDGVLELMGYPDVGVGPTTGLINQ